MSYDEPDALAAYADEFGVTFPLLSDPDSEIIERFGILNTLIAADDHPWFGIPYPGTFVIDGDGIITAKFFESHLALRPNADQLMRAALGETIEIAAAGAAPPTEVTVEVALDGASLAVGVLRDLCVTLRVPEGLHLYGEPVPEGMVATSVEFDDQVGLVRRPAVLPPTEPHTLAGTGETLQIFDGDVLIRVPISHNGRDLGGASGARTFTVSGRVRYQACDDDVCHLPASVPFSLTIPATGANVPSFRRDEGETGMDFVEHFNKMRARRGL